MKYWLVYRFDVNEERIVPQFQLDRRGDRLENILAQSIRETSSSVDIDMLVHLQAPADRTHHRSFLTLLVEDILESLVLVAVVSVYHLGHGRTDELVPKPFQHFVVIDPIDRRVPKSSLPRCLWYPIDCLPDDG